MEGSLTSVKAQYNECSPGGILPCLHVGGLLCTGAFPRTDCGTMRWRTHQGGEVVRLEAIRPITANQTNLMGALVLESHEKKKQH